MSERRRANVVPQLNKASCRYAQISMRKLAMCFCDGHRLILRLTKSANRTVINSTLASTTQL